MICAEKTEEEEIQQRVLGTGRGNRSAGTQGRGQWGGGGTLTEKTGRCGTAEKWEKQSGALAAWEDAEIKASPTPAVTRSERNRHAVMTNQCNRAESTRSFLLSTFRGRQRGLPKEFRMNVPDVMYGDTKRDAVGKRITLTQGG